LTEEKKSGECSSDD